MENIFIDTCLYKEWKYIASATLKVLLDAAKTGKIRILLPEITELETQKHIREDIADELQKIGKSSTTIKLIPTVLDHLNNINELATAEKMIKMFEEQLRLANVCRIPTSNDLDLRSIMDLYFKIKPPFSQKKPKEFPDALVLKTLEKWCKENNLTCITLSNDEDFKNYTSDYLTSMNAKEYIADLTDRIQKEKKKEEEIRKISFNSLINLRNDSDIAEKLKDWVYEQLDNEVLYCCALQIDEINDFSILGINIDYPAEVELIGTFDETLVFRADIKATTEINVDHPDYDSAYYDSEDNQWYFIDDSVETKMTSTIKIFLDYTTDLNGNNLEIDDYNMGHNLSRKVVIESLE